MSFVTHGVSEGDKATARPPARPGILKINWVQVTAAALAAVSSAAALATLGVAGTLIGAAVGSIIATTASTVYMYGLARTRDRLRRAAIRRDDQEGTTGGEPVAPADLDTTSLPGRRARIGRIIAVSLAALAIALAAITAFELVTGRALSSLVSGSDEGPTRPSIVGGAPREPAPDNPQAPDEGDGDVSSPSPDEDRTPTPTTPAPTEPAEPTPTAKPTPTVEPTEEPVVPVEPDLVP